MEQSAGIVQILIFAALYAFSAYCLLLIAKKTDHEKRAWWAWIPFLNIFLMIQIAGKPWWWFFLLLIPLVGLIFLTLVWAGLCRERSRNPWLSLLIWVPVANLGLLAYLAFSDGGAAGTEVRPA